ncbi:phage holin, lambda family [Halomonas sp. WWR20]
MPSRDPSNWQALIGVLASIWPHVYAATLAFVVALVRSLHSGGKPLKSFLEALLCGCLTLALKPVLDYAGISPDLAVAIGAGIAFLGVEWLRERAEGLMDKVFGKWFGK